MRRLLLAPIKFYRKYLTQRKKAPCCRFTPSCSRYAFTAINEWGIIIGLPMAVFRLLRCNPIFKGGEDFVPRRKRKLIPKTELFSRKLTVKGCSLPSYPYLTTYGSLI